jgi:hypothetical protein
MRWDGMESANDMSPSRFHNVQVAGSVDIPERATCRCRSNACVLEVNAASLGLRHRDCT